MSHIVSRGGGLHVRMGGNTQEFAYFVDHIPNYRATEKQGINTSNPVRPIPSALPTSSQLSSDTNARCHVFPRFLLSGCQYLRTSAWRSVVSWYAFPLITSTSMIDQTFQGIPMNDSNWRLQIAEYGQKILGKNLLGLQAGNEPDYYGVYVLSQIIKALSVLTHH